MEPRGADAMDEPDGTRTGDQGEQHLAFATHAMQEGLIGVSAKAAIDDMWAVFSREAKVARLRERGCNVDAGPDGTAASSALS